MSARAGLLLSAALLYSCDRICGDDSNANVAGEWAITAEAECTTEAEGVDSDIEISASASVLIAQSNSGGGLTLVSAPRVEGTSVELTGDVNGSCVDFTWREIGEGYSIAYTFKGVVDGNSITGDVTGTGEGLCPFQGDFNVDIVPRSVSPSPDGGVSDAGTSSTTPDSGLSMITPRSCASSSQCNEGACLNGRCAIMCMSASDCAVGEKCINGRCDPAQGCNCATSHESAGGLGLGLALFLLLACARRR